MMPRCNLHTHTTYCDGKNTSEEMVIAAIGAGFEVLGFSGHSPLAGEDWSMPEERVAEYIAEVLRLREKYADEIEIALGLEYDMLSVCDTEPFDYIIGSVHFVEKCGITIPVDARSDILCDAVQKCYGGDFYAFARDYYDNMYHLLDKTRCDIVGHFDLLTKFNEGGRLFDESDARYRKYALEALDHLLERQPIIEINTGAISRGHRKSPYPADFILRRIAERGGRVMINSDCHTAKGIDTYFPEAVEYARFCGIKELTVWKNGSFSGVGI